MFSGLFDEVAESYDAVGVDFFQVFAAELVRRAEPPIGGHVLDLGTGRGAALFRLAEAVGPTGSVLGIDLSPGMITRTSADLAARDLPQATVRLGDVDDPPTREGGWDLAVASLVLFFLPDPAAAAARIHDVLAPNGRFAMTSFGPDDPTWSVVAEPFAKRIPQGLTRRNVGPFSSDEGVARLLRNAGFTISSNERLTHEVRYADVDTVVRWTRSTGTQAWWNLIPVAEHPQVEAELRAGLATIAAPDGSLTETTSVRYTVAAA